MWSNKRSFTKNVRHTSSNVKFNMRREACRIIGTEFIRSFKKERDIISQAICLTSSLFKIKKFNLLDMLHLPFT